MKILIVSDTHRKDENLKWVIRKTKPFDILLHLGDAEGSEYEIMKWVDKGCDLEMIMGNNDFFSPLDREKEIELGGKKIWLTHGHNYYVSLDLKVIEQEAVARGMDIVMFGHTHRPVIIVEDNITLINPGSISYPRQADGIPTYIILEINDNNEFNFELKNV